MFPQSVNPLLPPQPSPTLLHSTVPTSTNTMGIPQTSFQPNFPQTHNIQQINHPQNLLQQSIPSTQPYQQVNNPTIQPVQQQRQHLQQQRQPNHPTIQPIHTTLPQQQQQQQQQQSNGTIY